MVLFSWEGGIIKTRCCHRVQQHLPQGSNSVWNPTNSLSLAHHAWVSIKCPLLFYILKTEGLWEEVQLKCWETDSIFLQVYDPHWEPRTSTKCSNTRERSWYHVVERHGVGPYQLISESLKWGWSGYTFHSLAVFLFNKACNFQSLENVIIDNVCISSKNTISTQGMKTPLKSHPLRLWCLSPANAFRQANIGNGLWMRPTHTWILL